MRIAIVGAGFAGLSNAKILTQFGHNVTVYDKTPDVGGVWSVTRRYPGLTTQNNKGTYHLPGFPMPRDYPQWPSGEQVQRYLAEYVERFQLGGLLRLNTEVVHAGLDEQRGRWHVTGRDVRTGDESAHFYDHLVVANGIFSDPFVPWIPGRAEFEQAGGKLSHATEFRELEDARGKDVVVVGYGKSSCDVAVAISEVASSTTVVARELMWKMPKWLGSALNYKFLMLTRMGEGLFRYIKPHGFERFLHGWGKPVRDGMLATVQAVATRQLKLKELDLTPDGGFERIARSTVSLVTDGFFERVREGQIGVHRDCVLSRLYDKDGRPTAELSTGERIPADVIVCGTGFRQTVPFLDADIQDRLTDERGNFRLYRQIKPLDVPHLSFSGYNSSFFSPLSAEVAGLWIACRLMGGLTLPPLDRQRAHVEKRLRWMEQRTDGRHARGTNIIPFSMHNVDEMLSDLDLNLGPLHRAVQWALPVNPQSYRKLTRELLHRRRHFER